MDDDNNDSGSGKDSLNDDNDTVVARVIEMGITVPFLSWIDITGGSLRWSRHLAL